MEQINNCKERQYSASAKALPFGVEERVLSAFLVYAHELYIIARDIKAKANCQVFWGYCLGMVNLGPTQVRYQ